MCNLYENKTFASKSAGRADGAHCRVGLMALRAGSSQRVITHLQDAAQREGIEPQRSPSALLTAA